MIFVLTLHTLTEWNLLGRVQGQTDIPLSSRGKSDAAKIAEKLSGLGVSSIVSSDLARARETAEIFNNTLQVPMRVDIRLREYSFGKLEGLTREQAVQQYGPSIISHWDDKFRAYDFRLFGGEQREDVFSRHLAVIQSLHVEAPEQKILLVGHSGGMNTLLGGLGYPSDLEQGQYRIIAYPSADVWL